MRGRRTFWRVSSPLQFHSHLPSLFESVETDAQAGEFNAGCIREKLRQIIQPGQSDQTSGFDLRLRAGVLHIGEQPFSLNAFRRWQIKRWAECRRPALTYAAKSEDNVSAMAAVRHAFSSLEADQWIKAGELKVILDVFCGQLEGLDAHEICKHGWVSGCLARRTRQNEAWYRWAPAEKQPSTLDDDVKWMMPDSAGGIGINLISDSILPRP